MKNLESLNKTIDLKRQLNYAMRTTVDAEIEIVKITDNFIIFYAYHQKWSIKKNSKGKLNINSLAAAN